MPGPSPPAALGQGQSSGISMSINSVMLFSCSGDSDSLQPHGLYPTRLLCLWDFPGKNTEVGCHFLFQVIFLVQRLNPYLLHWQVDILPLSYTEKPSYAPQSGLKFSIGKKKKKKNSPLGTQSCIVFNKHSLIHSLSRYLKSEHVSS